MKKTVRFAAALLFIATTASAQVNWKVEKKHSNISFKVKYLLINTVEGRFNDFNIVLSSNSADDFTNATLKATLKAASINTDNENRDDHLRSEDFLNVEKFPEITFVTKSFKKAEGNRYKVTGNLTIKEVTKSVELDAAFNGVVDSDGSTITSFHASGEINRFDFNVKWNRTLDHGGLVVGKTIFLDFFVELKYK